MSAPWSRSPVRAGAGCLLLALAGCAALGAGPEEGSEGGPGPAAGRDTAPAAAPSDTAVAGESDGTLRDSVLAVLKSRRAAGDTAREGAGGRPGAAQPGEGDGAGPSGAVRVTYVDSLKALGPVYTPYDVRPILRTEGLEGLLRATILPVIQKHDLAPDEWARFWVLVDREGRVADHRLHLTSGHAAFDAAAAAAAQHLRYRPAYRDDAPVPVWVLVRVSLLMG